MFFFVNDPNEYYQFDKPSTIFTSKQNMSYTSELPPGYSDIPSQLVARCSSVRYWFYLRIFKMALMSCTRNIFNQFPKFPDAEMKQSSTNQSIIFSISDQS